MNRSISSAAEQKIIARITRNLQPVRPLGPPSLYAMAIALCVLLTAAVGIAFLGTRGWHADSVLERATFTSLLTVALAAVSLTLAHLMAPGTLLRFRPMALVIGTTVALLGGTLLYPVLLYPGFAKAIGVCLTIGLSFALATSLLIYLVIRRGAFLARHDLLSTVGLAAGIAGVSVLTVFCPHRDLGHIALAHAMVPPAAAIVGIALAVHKRNKNIFPPKS